jgi:hypothetical protein
MICLGTVPAGTSVYIPFSTYAGSTGASATCTGLAVTDVEIYKNGSTTQRASDAGVALLDTDGIDFDGITGLHGFSIDLNDNTDAGFFAVGSWYWVVVSSITVDSQTVTFLAATFRIGPAEAVAGYPLVDVYALSGDATAANNAESFFDGTGYAGTNNVIPLVTTTTTATNVTTVNALAANVITAASINAAALNGKGDWNVGKTGYALTATTGLGNQTANITGNLSGSVGSVTGAVGSVTGSVGSVATAGNEAIADAVINRNIQGGSNTGRTVRQALAALRNKVVVSGGTMTVYATDDSASEWTASVTTTAGNPITTIDPA